MSTTIDISGLNKGAVLAALYNASAPMGMGVFQAQAGNMTVAQAQAHIDADSTPDYPGKKPYGKYYFDYLHGRPLKVNLKEDAFDGGLFDRDNGGPGSAARIVEALRASQKQAA